MTRSCPTCEHISGPDEVLCNCETDTSLCERAFPDFNIDFDVYGLTDASYKNDTCPSWHTEDSRWHIYTDYADNDRREVQGHPRFIYCQIDSEGEQVGEYQMSDNWGEVRRVTG